MNKTQAIISRLKDVDPDARRAACESASEIKDAEFIPELVNALYDSNLGVREAGLNALTSIGGSRVAEAVSPLLRSNDPSIRNMGVEIIQLIGAEALPVLSTLLNDPDDDVVKFAVDILANMKEERVVDVLMTLTNHANANVRAAVAVCLGRVGARNAMPALLGALSDPEIWVRFSAIESIGSLCDPAALPPLLKIIENDTGLTREAAIDAVSKIASTSDAANILLRLEPLLSRGEIVGVASIVELVEKAFSPGSSFRPSAGFKASYLAFFTRAVDDSEKGVRISGLKGLGLLKMPEGLKKVFAFLDAQKEMTEEMEALVVDVVVSMAGHGKIPVILLEELKKGERNLRLAVRALGGMKSEDAVPVLKGLMQTVSRHELREVVAALEAIGSIDSIEVLSGSLKSADGHARKTAARAYATLAGEGAVRSLFDALRVENYRDVMEEITDVLALIPADMVKKGFYELLTNERAELREMGARGLGLVGDEEALQYLKKAAHDADPSVRKAAYNSLARIGAPEAVDAVISGLRDDDDEVKLSVLKALGGWSGEKIKKALIAALSDGNIWVRYHAVLLLGELRENDVEERILEMLVNDSPPVKAAAAKALEKTGTSRAIPVLERFADHPDTAVSGAVRDAIGILQC
ncbi:MAG: HEAT repeat domain-containing protein [Deltaproteobacteria bacterium]|nr:HEAT repeat domain-containing protein [Deltaproteobacteria bacterium]